MAQCSVLFMHQPVPDAGKPEVRKDLGKMPERNDEPSPLSLKHCLRW